MMIKTQFKTASLVMFSALLAAAFAVPAQAQTGGAGTTGSGTGGAAGTTSGSNGSGRGTDGIDGGTNVYPGSAAGTSTRPVNSYDSRGGVKTDARRPAPHKRGGSTTTSGAVNLNGPAGGANMNGTTTQSGAGSAN